MSSGPAVSMVVVVVAVSVIMMGFILPMMGGPTQSMDEESELTAEQKAEMRSAFDSGLMSLLRGLIGLLLTVLGGLKLNDVVIHRLRHRGLTP